MERFRIQGGRRLSGRLRVCGAKNSILPILAATLLDEKPVTIYDCPNILDVRNMLSILEQLGCEIERDTEQSIARIDAQCAHRWEMPESLSKELRSSIFMLGPVLGRFKRAKFAYPGGCEIGARPIDLHLKGLRQLNVHIVEEHGQILCDGTQMKSGEIHLDYPSVGATENIMMAAVFLEGTTAINNAAREPEIVDLQNFLCAGGVKVTGAGSSTIYVEGTKKLSKIEYRIMPDRIITGTYMVAAAMTAGDIYLQNVKAADIGSVISKLREVGCQIDLRQDALHIRGPRRPQELQIIETLPYPGFPTDMQAQMFALGTIGKGTSVIIENVFSNRFKHAHELTKMGANVTIKDRLAIIRGVERLTGTEVEGKDLRGGAALCLAGLRAEGTTTVLGVHHVDRGYEALEEALSALGADISREFGDTDELQSEGNLDCADGHNPGGPGGDAGI